MTPPDILVGAEGLSELERTAEAPEDWRPSTKRELRVAPWSTKAWYTVFSCGSSMFVALMLCHSERDVLVHGDAALVVDRGPGARGEAGGGSYVPGGGGCEFEDRGRCARC